MQPFEYLSVLVSMIVGLGLSHLLRAAARLIQVRHVVRMYGPTLIWMGLLFLLQIQIWWAAFEWQSASPWTFVGFLLFLGLPIGAYVLSVLLVPDLDAPEGMDLRASYFRNRRWFFALLAGLPLLSLLHERVHSGAIVWDADVAFRLGFLVVALVGLGVRREPVHWGLAAGFATGFAAYVLLLFLRLP